MIRIIFLAAFAAFVIYIIIRLMKPSPFVRCGRCDGKGYWYDARGRETCDWCKGSGKLPRDLAQ